jgi:hypothetical protein
MAFHVFRRRRRSDVLPVGKPAIRQVENLRYEAAAWAEKQDAT